MDDAIYNGMPTDQLPPSAKKRKSTRSGPNGGNCVELSALPGGKEVAITNSRFPEGPALIFTSAEMKALVEGIRDGEFDDLIA